MEIDIQIIIKELQNHNNLTMEHRTGIDKDSKKGKERIEKRQTQKNSNQKLIQIINKTICQNNKKIILITVIMTS